MQRTSLHSKSYTKKCVQCNLCCSRLFGPMKADMKHRYASPHAPWWSAQKQWWLASNHRMTFTSRALDASNFNELKWCTIWCTIFCTIWCRLTETATDMIDMWNEPTAPSSPVKGCQKRALDTSDRSPLKSTGLSRDGDLYELLSLLVQDPFDINKS